MASPVVSIILRARDEASSTVKRLAGELGAMTGPLGRIANAAGPVGLIAGAAASAAGAAVALARQLSDNVERLDRLAAASGTSIEQLQILERTFKNAGLSSEDASQALVFLNRAIGRGEPLLRELGITSRNAFDALLQLGDVFARSEDAAKKQAIALKLTGRSSSELVGVMSTLRAAVAQTGAEMEAAGAIVTDKAAKPIRELDKQLDSLAINWQGVWTQSTKVLVPAANVIVTEINRIIVKLKELSVSTPVKIVIRWVVEGAEDKARSDQWHRERLEQLKTLTRGTEEYRRVQRELIEGPPVPQEPFKGFGGGTSRDADRLRQEQAEASPFGALPSGESPRERELKRIMTLLKVSRTDAIAYADSLDKVRAAREASQGTQEPGGDREGELKRVMALLQVSRKDAEAYADAIDKVLAAREDAQSANEPGGDRESPRERELKRVMALLKVSRKDAEAYTDAIDKVLAARESQQSPEDFKWEAPPPAQGERPGPPKKDDSLANINLSEGGDRESPRERELKRIMALLQVSRKDAIAYADALDEIRMAKEATALRRDLGLPQPVPRGETAAPQTAGDVPNVSRAAAAAEESRAREAALRAEYERVRDTQKAWAEFYAVVGATRDTDAMEAAADRLRQRLIQLGEDGPKAMRELAKATDEATEAERRRQEVERRREERKRDRKDVRKAVEEAIENLNDIASPAQTAARAIYDTFNNLSTVIEGSIKGLARRTLKLKDALTGIWRAIKDAVIRAISDMIAAMITKLIIVKALSAIFTALGVPVSIATPAANVVAGPATDKITTSGSPATSSAEPQIVNNVTIQSYDLRDAVSELTSPGGVLRRANTRLAITGAY